MSSLKNHANILPSFKFPTFVAGLVVLTLLATTARADTSYLGTLEATLTVAGFLDAERNPIPKPTGLTLENIITFADDSFVVVEGDATADADAVIDVIADNPSDLVMDDRFDFHFTASGTTVYPTGFSYASPSGNVFIVADNGSPDPVTILFNFQYEYALNTSVDDPALEYAYVIADYGVVLGVDIVHELFSWIENNDSREGMGTQPFEVTLLPGQFEGISVFAGVTGDPFGPAVPEPKSWLVAIIGGLMLSGGPRNLFNRADTHLLLTNR